MFVFFHIEKNRTMNTQCNGCVYLRFVHFNFSLLYKFLATFISPHFHSKTQVDTKYAL